MRYPSLLSVFLGGLLAAQAGTALASTPAPKCDADPSRDGVFAAIQMRVDHVKSMAEISKQEAGDLQGPAGRAGVTAFGLSILTGLVGGAGYGITAAGADVFATTVMGGAIGGFALMGTNTIAFQKDAFYFVNSSTFNAITSSFEARHRAAKAYFDDGQENSPPSFLREYLTLGWSATNHLNRMMERAKADAAIYTEEATVLETAKQAMLKACHIMTDQERDEAAQQVRNAVRGKVSN